MYLKCEMKEKCEVDCAAMGQWRIKTFTIGMRLKVPSDVRGNAIWLLF